MKKQMAFCVMAFFTMMSYAQFNITGTVKDAQSQESLPGANLTVKNTTYGVHSNFRGQFRLQNLEEGNYVLLVTFLGYKPQEIDLSITENKHLDVLLERTSTLSPEVIVQATRADLRSPVTQTNISREELQKNNFGQDIPFLLNMTPSLIVSSDAGAGVGYTWMNIRGSDNSRINVTVNGIPVNDAESHGVWWVNMPDIASSTDNIQIQRGVGTSTHGAASFGATVSLETTTLQDKPYADITAATGSFNTLRNTLLFGTGLMENNWAFDGRLSRITSDGFVDRAESDLMSYYLSGGYYGGNTVIKAVAFSGRETTYQAWNGVPSDSLEGNRTFNPSGMYRDEDGNTLFYDNETDNYQQDHYQLHVSNQLNPDLLWNFSAHYTYGRGYYEQYRANERFSRYGLDNPVIEDVEFTRTDLIRRRWLDNHFYGITTSAHYQMNSQLETTVGLGYNIYEGDHFGEIIWARLSKDFDKGHRYYDNDATKTDFNTFAKMSYEIADGFLAFADLQYRNIQYNFLGKAWVLEEVQDIQQDANFDFINPKLGFLYEMNQNHSMQLFSGISNREPVRRDFTESSPESRPKHETLYNVELGYNYTGTFFRGGVNLYHMQYDNQLIPTGEINDVGGLSRANIKDSYRQGIELEAGVIVNEWMQWSGNLTLSQSIIPEFTEFSDAYDDTWNWTGMDDRTYRNTHIAFSPSVIGASQIALSPLKGFSVSLLSKYVGKQYIDNTMSEDRMLDPYFVNDLIMSYTIDHRSIGAIELGVKLNNILDVDYITNAWVYKGYVEGMGLTNIADGYFPQAGRNFMLSMRLKL